MIRKVAISEAGYFEQTPGILYWSRVYSRDPKYRLNTRPEIVVKRNTIGITIMLFSLWLGVYLNKPSWFRWGKASPEATYMIGKKITIFGHNNFEKWVHKQKEDVRHQVAEFLEWYIGRKHNDN